MVVVRDGRAALPSRRPRWLVVLPLVLAFAALGSVGVYRYVDNFWLYRGFAPPKDAAWVRVKGQQESVEVTSPALGGRVQQVVVYLPPGYNAHPRRRYPTLYLLHGFPGRPLAFLETVRVGVLEDELVAAGRMQPLILVMPSGSTGTFTDKEWANGVHPGEGWETFVSRDVVAAIDTQYRTIRSAAGRAIGGLSEGGYGALNIGLHHPTAFKVLESWSGYMKADPIASIFGHSTRRLAYNSPLSYLQQVAATLRRSHTYVWFYTGSKDSFRTQNRHFDTLLGRYGVRHTFFVSPGGHTWLAWRDNAATALRVAASHLIHG
jgi:enterochelin esterase-like enzyme